MAKKKRIVITGPHGSGKSHYLSELGYRRPEKLTRAKLRSEICMAFGFGDLAGKVDEIDRLTKEISAIGRAIGARNRIANQVTVDELSIARAKNKLKRIEAELSKAELTKQAIETSVCPICLTEVDDLEPINTKALTKEAKRQREIISSAETSALTVSQLEADQSRLKDEAAALKDELLGHSTRVIDQTSAALRELGIKGVWFDIETGTWRHMCPWRNEEIDISKAPQSTRTLVAIYQCLLFGYSSLGLDDEDLIGLNGHSMELLANRLQSSSIPKIAVVAQAHFGAWSCWTQKEMSK